jgi:uncharacterized protein (TIGR03086 family)
MSQILDLAPAANQVKSLLANVTDDQLSARTPCEHYTVGDILDHFMGLTLAFRYAAVKDDSLASAAPSPSADQLDPDWRSKLPQQLDELAAAWKDPAAWDGTTAAGGVTLPAEVMGLVALDELVLHGWDLARGTGQPFECDPDSTDAVFTFTSMSAEEPAESREGIFGPVVDVPADAPLFDRALGLSGRDPHWTAPGGS